MGHDETTERGIDRFWWRKRFMLVPATETTDAKLVLRSFPDADVFQVIREAFAGKPTGVYNADVAACAAYCEYTAEHPEMSPRAILGPASLSSPAEAPAPDKLCSRESILAGIYELKWDWQRKVDMLISAVEALPDHAVAPTPKTPLFTRRMTEILENRRVINGYSPIDRCETAVLFLERLSSNAKMNIIQHLVDQKDGSPSEVAANSLLDLAILCQRIAEELANFPRE